MASSGAEDETQEFDELTGLFTPKNELVPQTPDKINVFVTLTDGDGALQYKIYRTEALKTLMKNACSKLDLQESEVSFMREGVRVKEDDTAQKLNIGDNDDITIVRNATASNAVEVANEANTEKCVIPDEKIQITVSIENKELCFKQKKTSDLKKLFRTACEKFGINQGEVAFCFDGERILDSSSPESLGMDDSYARIEIFQRQSGGGGVQADG